MSRVIVRGTGFNHMLEMGFEPSPKPDDRHNGVPRAAEFPYQTPGRLSGEVTILLQYETEESMFWQRGIP